MRMSDWSADVCSSDLWRSGNCRWPGVLLSIVSVASATATAMLPGAVGLHWFYAALMASYLLMGVGEASLLIIAAVTFLVVDGGAFASLTQMWTRSEEHTSELQSLMRISYAVFCLKKKKEH